MPTKTLKQRTCTASRFSTRIPAHSDAYRQLQVNVLYPVTSPAAPPLVTCRRFLNSRDPPHLRGTMSASAAGRSQASISLHQHQISQLQSTAALSYVLPTSVLIFTNCRAAVKMAPLSSLGLNLRLADIDENLKSHPAALSWPTASFASNAASLNHDFIDDAPCFAYTEVFESGEIFQAVSPGLGVYLPLYSSPASQPAFTVSKSRLSKSIEIEYQSLTLLQSLAIAMPSPFDLPDLLTNYAILKSQLQHLETISPSHPTTVELRLLVRDVLLDRALFAGIGTEVYRSNGMLSIGQLHDMHQRSVDAGLDDLDACFALGLLPDVLDDAFLDALASKFTELALAGDLTALHDLCEPVVRTGEVEWETNPELLLELLDRGRLDIYRYVLDLASRTRDKSTSQSGSFLRDITNDPLHVAIRLGHVTQVESLLRQGATFLGVYADDEMSGGTENVVLTPFSAAVFWGQAEIVRTILLQTLVPEGLREAVAIAVSDEKTEIMEIMLSFGVMDTIGSTTTDDTFDCFADLSIMEPTSTTAFQRVPSGTDYTRTEVDAASSLTGGINASQPSAPCGRRLHRAADTPRERVRRKCSRRRRRLLGQSLVSSMHSLCSQLRDFCDCSDHAEVNNMGGDYTHSNTVWDRGLGVFRGLMQDSPPSSLVEVFDALLVANATYLTLYTSDDSLSLEFVDDLDRWRSILPASSQLLFDDLAFHMWGYTPLGQMPLHPDSECLPHFQDLAQNLISLEKRKESIPSRISTPGIRLAAIQRAFENQETHLGVASSQAQTIPGRSQSGQTSYAGSSTQRDDLFWADFLHMDRLEDTTLRQPAPSSSLNGGWEDVLSSTMLLLFSVAFSIVLGLILGNPGLHSGSKKAVTETVTTTLSGYSRCYALIAEYLRMHGISIQPSLSAGQLSIPSLAAQSPAHGSEVCTTPSSSFSSLSTLGLRRDVSSSSISSIGSAAGSATSRSTPRDHRNRGDRLPCLTPQCTKTFSSVSNRNKHLREGCAFNREKRQGYPCRNTSCSKVLTTKWYRDTHEKERCRFRRGY
ncbi:hypothetical protein CORC01_14205 [Colletotrichum orchidophilum]|uniref:Uncharacterized protein n=1 Tax=Colletotrichum orchidophilum TaxID=1209926 RepID=A0A1G4AN01_9PEZI|nr:uncharacterized protein CORC01_14205 [Colletotrichum orchidophilum]OHE90501.1 hypothetical protein CORC01_14205 [Colletotrichum orchidophilum]